MQHLDEKGLTLVEVLAALALLSLAVFSFVQISSYTGLSKMASDEKVEALLKAEDVLNQLRDTAPAQMQDKIDSINEASYAGEKYAIYVSESQLSEANPSFSPPGTGSRMVSATAVVNKDKQPVVLVVTVSWEGGVTP